MPAKTRSPNELLRRVMTEVGVTNHGLARRIVDATAKTKNPIRADHNDVRKWLDGMVPRSPKPQVIAHVLSTLVGRRLTLVDIGFEGATSDEHDVLARGTHYQTDAAAALQLLSTLADSDMRESRPVVESLWVPDAAHQIVTGYMFAKPVAVGGYEPERLAGVAAAEQIRTTAAQLMDMDFQFGGGHVRHMLLSYFRKSVVPLLRKHHADAVRREIFSAAGEVAQLLGWSAYDAGRHGAAMRYFTQGLRIAREAEDAMLGGRLLSNLSHQANFLGDYGDAVMFARAAQQTTFGRVTKNVLAMYTMMEARGLANLGDQKDTAHTVQRAESLYEQRNTETEPAWISYYDAEELAGDAAHAFRDLGDGAETRRFVQRALGDGTPPRTRAFLQMVSAEASLRAGDADEAMSTAMQAVSLGGTLKSARYIQYLRDFHQSLRKAKVATDRMDEFTHAVRNVYPAQ